MAQWAGKAGIVANRETWTVRLSYKGTEMFLVGDRKYNRINESQFASLGLYTMYMAKQAADHWASTLNTIRTEDDKRRGITFDAIKPAPKGQERT